MEKTVQPGMTLTSEDLFCRYRDKIDDFIFKALPLFGEKTLLRDACAYALSSGGKRFRPLIVLMVADAIGYGADVRFSAMGVELFHTASLVADDLPSMDDDDERRNQPAVHKKFGEGIALLSSYALIAAGYECLAKNAEVVRQAALPFSSNADRIGMLALSNASTNTGLQGATGGQFLDVAATTLSLEGLKEIIHKKTSTLFEISFVYGWLFGGGDLCRLEEVKQAASHFGLAFQIADDLGDMEQDLANQRIVNAANVLGKEAALEMFHVELQQFIFHAQNLGIFSSELKLLAEYLSDLALFSEC